MDDGATTLYCITLHRVDYHFYLKNGTFNWWHSKKLCITISSLVGMHPLKEMVMNMELKSTLQGRAKKSIRWNMNQQHYKFEVLMCKAFKSIH